MTVRISDLTALTNDVAQSDLLPIVDIGAQETKKITVGNLLQYGISGMPSGTIDLAVLNQSSSTKLSSAALASIISSGTFGSADTVPQFSINDKGLVTYASGIAIAITASSVSGLAAVATSGTYASLTDLPTLGTIASQDAASVQISGGTVENITLITGNATISGGTISGIVDLAIADGGTGASTAADARSNLGLAIGSDVQPYSSTLSGIATATTSADQLLYTTASGVFEASSITSLGRSIVSGSTTADVRSTIGLGTMAVQDAASIVISGGTIENIVLTTGNVTISGGTISGITDLAIADGGTGASSAADARTNLGLAIGTDVQAYSAALDSIVNATSAADQFIYTSASGNFIAANVSALGRSIVSGSTESVVRTTLGLGDIALQNSANILISGGTIAGIDLTTGNATISGGTISGITDLAIADGGTGASTAANARTNLGLAIGSDVQAYSSTLSGLTIVTTGADEMLYTTSSGVFAVSPISSIGRAIISGSTASTVRTTLGLGNMSIQEPGSVTISGGTIVGITDIAVADGGTGASTASAARTNLGLVIGTDVQAYDAGLASIAGLATSSGTLLYTTDSDAYTTIGVDDFMKTMLASGTSAGAVRSYIGLGAIALNNAITSADISAGGISGVSIASGTIGSGLIAANAIFTDALQDAAVATIKIVDSGVTADKLADNSSSIVDVGAPITAGNFIGQQYFDTVTSFEYIWDGDSWERQAAINTIDFVDSTPLNFVVSYPDDYSATITSSLDNQAVNTIFAGPVSGASTTPTFRNLTAADLPVATSNAIGAVSPGAGLSVDAGGAMNHSNSFAAGEYIGLLTIDAQGHITSAATSLIADQIPELDASKITTGTFSSERLAINSVTAEQLADNGIAQVSESAPNPQFAGQWWVNPSDRSSYIWVGQIGETLETSNGYWLNLGYGNLQNENLRFAGTYNASGNTIATVTQYSTQAGLDVGEVLTAPSESNNGLYYIVTISGYGTGAAPVGTLSPGDWVVSLGQGANWETLDFASAVAGVSDTDVLVNGPTLVPAASGIATQRQLNLDVWSRVQVATTFAYGIVRASTEIAVASGTGIMSIGIIDDGSY